MRCEVRRTGSKSVQVCSQPHLDQKYYWMRHTDREEVEGQEGEINRREEIWVDRMLERGQMFGVDGIVY